MMEVETQKRQRKKSIDVNEEYINRKKGRNRFILVQQIWLFPMLQHLKICFFAFCICCIIRVLHSKREKGSKNDKVHEYDNDGYEYTTKDKNIVEKIQYWEVGNILLIFSIRLT